MIAILTHNLRLAIDTLHKRGDVEQYNHSTRKGMFKSRREFVIVNAQEQLEGMRLSDYIIVGEPDELMVQLAKTRVR